MRTIASCTTSSRRSAGIPPWRVKRPARTWSRWARRSSRALACAPPPERRSRSHRSLLRRVRIPRKGYTSPIATRRVRASVCSTLLRRVGGQNSYPGLQDLARAPTPQTLARVDRHRGISESTVTLWAMDDRRAEVSGKRQVRIPGDATSNQAAKYDGRTSTPIPGTFQGELK